MQPGRPIIGRGKLAFAVRREVCGIAVYYTYRGFWIVLFCLFLLTGLGRQTAAAAPETPNYLMMSPTPVLDPTNGLGSWIWAEQTLDDQFCRLWRVFEIPTGASVTYARLRMTVDNSYVLYLDGRQVGRGSDWRSLTEFDLTWVLSPGLHVIAVDGYNDKDQAGLIMGLHVEMSDGAKLEIGSDANWRVVPASETDWQRRTKPRANWVSATIKGALGASPWWRNPLRISNRPPVMPFVLRFWQTGWFQVSMFTACCLVCITCLRLTAKLAVHSKAQNLLQLERARIARDIHDDLGAGLTQVVLLGEVAKSELPGPSETRRQIDQICERTRDLSRSMDEIVWAVNSRRDTLRDFATYVCKYAQGFMQSTPIRCRLDVEPDLPALPFDLPIRRNLFLAAKEALNNAVKHSEATELFLRIHRVGEGLKVVVVDNGKGFDPARAGSDRNGLTNMHQRMLEVGGTCRISGGPGRGCEVEFFLPALHAQESPWFKFGFGRTKSAATTTAATPLPVLNSPRIPAKSEGS